MSGPVVVAGSLVVLDRESALALAAAVRSLAGQLEAAGRTPMLSADVAAVYREYRARVESLSTGGYRAVAGVPVPRAPSPHDESTLSASAAAARWGLTDSYVRRLCRAGAVAGAVADDRGRWRIPAAAARPSGRCA